MKRYAILPLGIFFAGLAHAQNLTLSNQQGLKAAYYTDRNQEVIQFSDDIPLFSFRVNRLPIKDPPIRETEQGWVIPDFGFWLDSAAKVEITGKEESLPCPLYHILSQVKGLKVFGL